MHDDNPLNSDVHVFPALWTRFATAPKLPPLPGRIAELTFNQLAKLISRVAVASGRVRAGVNCATWKTADYLAPASTESPSTNSP